MSKVYSWYAFVGFDSCALHASGFRRTPDAVSKMICDFFNSLKWGDVGPFPFMSARNAKLDIYYICVCVCARNCA